MATRKKNRAAVKKVGARARQKDRPPSPAKSAQASGPARAAVLTLRTQAKTIEVTHTQSLASAAMEWTYVVRNRQRWRSLRESSMRLDARARSFLLDDLKIAEDAIESIATEGAVEVAVAFGDEEDGWEQRIFPWEFVLSAATRTLRRGPLTVTRQLITKFSGKPAQPSSAEVLYVESAPGSLSEDYSFTSERLLVESNLLKGDSKPYRLETPTLAGLAQIVGSRKPEVIHLAGFDTHQGLSELGFDGAKTPDGYLMIDEKGVPLAVSAQSLADALTAENHRPRLVSFALNNSGARSAALAVAAGAQAAIGVQDEIDDELLELFYASFYRYWRQEEGDLYGAFRAAWTGLTEASQHLTDGSLVLWTSDALLLGSIPSRSVTPAPVWSPLEAGEKRREALKFDIKHCNELNYSQLHNGEPLFEKFLLINNSAHLQDSGDVQAVLADVDVSVTLSAGAERTCFKRRVAINNASLDLRRDIHVPLISELMRSVHESISTSLEVEVDWGGPLFIDSFRVRLLPVDQWRDNDLDGKWLPSFVLPRDRAIANLIEKAQRYVRVVRDDPTAGFDGYQSFDAKGADPAGEVDRQVQAIWSMIVHELDLGYINPPPSYSNALDSQRLRTPSMVVSGRCGTCIDLALLLAACLEHIDVHPVIFLLQDHAFPGYWRDASFRQEFFEVATSIPADVGTEQKDRTEVAGAQTVPWWLRHPMAYREIRRNVESGRLVPLESVWLTERSGFFDAVDGGRDNLKSARRWHSMLDIVRAREEGVTPLPVGNQS
jgi:hypothetical protein